MMREVAGWLGVVAAASVVFSVGLLLPYGAVGVR